MAASRFKTDQYYSENFVESAGAILFHRSTRRICLVRHQRKNEWLLAKGRRNVAETVQQTAIREVTEETGFACRLLPLTLTTRAPPAVETGHSPDEPRTHTEVCEPFMMTLRHLDDGKNLKTIMWFIAEIDEASAKGDGEKNFAVGLFAFEEALKQLEYQLDRDILEKAISIFEASYPASLAKEGDSGE